MSERVKCPFCNRRVFDAHIIGLATINVKCLRCKNILHIHLGQAPRHAEAW